MLVQPRLQSSGVKSVPKLLWSRGETFLKGESAPTAIIAGSASKIGNHWNQALHLCLGAGSLTLKSLLQAASDVELSPKSPSSERYHALPATKWLNPSESYQLRAHVHVNVLSLSLSGFATTSEDTVQLAATSVGATSKPSQTSPRLLLQP